MAHVLEFLFFLGMAGSAYVVTKTTMEDFAVLFKKDVVDRGAEATGKE